MRKCKYCGANLLSKYDVHECKVLKSMPLDEFIINKNKHETKIPIHKPKPRNL